MRKTAALVIVLILVLLTFTGCKSGGGDALSTSPSSDSSSDKASKNQKLELKGMGNAPLNSYNEGYAVIADNLIYYTDRQNGGNLWSCSLNGTDDKIILEGNFRNINYTSGYLIFSDFSCIYMLKIGEAEPKIVIEDIVDQVFVLDEWIYYRNLNEIYRIKPDGTDKKLLVDNCSENFLFNDNKLYYLVYTKNQGYHLLWSTTIDGTKTEKISDAHMMTFIIYENKIYYDIWEEVYGVHQMSIDGTGSTKIHKDAVTLDTAIDGYIIASSSYKTDRSNPSKNMIKLSIDNGERTVFFEGFSFNLNIVGDWVYFCNNDENFRTSRIKLDGTGRELLGK